MILNLSYRSQISNKETVVKTRIFGRGVNTSAYVSTDSVTNKKSNGQCKLSCSPVVQPQRCSNTVETCQTCHFQITGQNM